MRYGIPRTAPRDVLDAEINRIIDLGVDVRLNHTVHDIERERREGGFDAVFLGVGAQLARRVAIPSGDSARILDASPIFTKSPTTTFPARAPSRGLRRGDTALDAARTARRLDATDAVIVYRRSREQMPAMTWNSRGAQRGHYRAFGSRPSATSR